jgi:raffinose/stachyose/melibiose transport system substrate-binding protein
MVRLGAGGKLQLRMLPLYTGAPGEENRGLSCFGKHYWCIRADAPEEEIAGALAFLNFLISPRPDGTVPVDDLGILSPYRQATYANNPVAQQLRQNIATGKVLTVCGAEPQYASGYAQALLTYASTPTDANWLAVLKAKNNLPAP